MHRVSVRSGDITALAIDAIVNAANQTLLGGGGVDGAIHRGAGSELLDACRALPAIEPGVRCPTGESRITSGFALPAKHVIHTVGPVWCGGIENEPVLLANCYRNSLTLAVENDLRTIAFPAISCGAYGYPIQRACQIAVRTIAEFLHTNESIESVILVAFEQHLYEALRDEVHQHRSNRD